MNPLGREALFLAAQPPAVAVTAIAFFLIAASFVAWGWIAERWRLRQPVLPYEPRRQAPWGAVDLVVILAVYLAAVAWAMQAGRRILGPADAMTPAIEDPLEAHTLHPVTRLLAEGKLGALLLCGFSAVVVAPVFEEFLFRVLLQGWLEKVERRRRRWIPTLRRLLPWGAGPILLSSLLFALMHFRVAEPAKSARYVSLVLVANALAGLMTLLFALVWLRLQRRASWRDLGFVASKFHADVRLGLLTFLAFAAPIYGLQRFLSRLLPDYLAADPLSLLVLAVVLGTLYCRTHRIVPSVVVHMALNGTSVAIGWLALGP